MSTVLTWVQNISGIIAIFALGWHVLGELTAQADLRIDTDRRINRAAWLGLACFAVYIACAVGKVGS